MIREEGLTCGRRDRRRPGRSRAPANLSAAAKTSRCWNRWSRAGGRACSPSGFPHRHRTHDDHDARAASCALRAAGADVARTSMEPLDPKSRRRSPAGRCCTPRRDREHMAAEIRDFAGARCGRIRRVLQVARRHILDGSSSRSSTPTTTNTFEIARLATLDADDPQGGSGGSIQTLASFFEDERLRGVQLPLAPGRSGAARRTGDVPLTDVHGASAASSPRAGRRACHRQLAGPAIADAGAMIRYDTPVSRIRTRATTPCHASRSGFRTPRRDAVVCNLYLGGVHPARRHRCRRGAVESHAPSALVAGVRRASR